LVHRGRRRTEKNLAQGGECLNNGRKKNHTRGSSLFWGTLRKKKKRRGKKLGDSIKKAPGDRPQAGQKDRKPCNKKSTGSRVGQKEERNSWKRGVLDSVWGEDIRRDELYR